MSARCPGKHCRPASVVVDVVETTRNGKLDRAFAPHKKPGSDSECIFSGAWVMDSDLVRGGS